MEPIPVVKQKEGISPVWILPIIALGICAWIVYASYQNAGITITIYFDDATGVTPGKTQVIARGIPVGTVTKTIPDIGNRRIQTIVEMDKFVADQLVEDTVFWIVRPEITAASVRGLDTLFSGSYIGVQPGSSKITSRTFEGLTSSPPISIETPGLHIKLNAEEMGSIQAGSEVYYRNVTIGTVTKTSLDQKDDTAIIDLFIQPEFSHLVRKGSRFSNASGISISGKLTNLKVHIESLSSILKGGIVLHTPEELQSTEPVENGYMFPLYKDIASAQYGIKMTLQLASSIGITEGETQLIYRGLVAGVVEKIDFNDDERHTVTAHIMLDPRAERILRQDTQFWIVKPEISTERIENLDTLLQGPYITFIPGGGKFRNNFRILPEPPPRKPLRPGEEFSLYTNEAHSIRRGAPIYYKSKKVGEVFSIELNSDTRTFEIPIFIYEQYVKLIQPNSVFWSDGGVSLRASLSGVQLKTNSLSAALHGGISFLSPPGDSVADSAKSSKRFPLHRDYEEALAVTPHLQPDGYRFRLITEEPDSIKRGTPLYYKKIKVGEVVGFNLSRDNKRVEMDCLIYQPYMDTVNSSSRFYDITGVLFQGNLTGVSMETDSLESIVSGGISYFTPKPSARRKKKSSYPLFSNKWQAEAIDTIPISVVFKQGDNLQVGAPVRFKGVEIGKVTDLEFTEESRDVLVQLQVKKSGEDFFRASTQLWLEKAEVSLSGIKNLRTVLFGSYINVLPGEGELRRSFTARIEPPTLSGDSTGGLHIILARKNLGSININSPVYYRQIEVGKVIDYGLSQDFKNVHITVNIEEPYTPLIRKNTRFWLASGAKIEGGLFSGVSVSVESIEALITGGIAFATPADADAPKPVENNHLFKLHKKAKQEWLDWEPNIVIVDKEKAKTKL